MEEILPIKYTSGGRLGDFINQLSVINENYIKTGRKGVLYIGYTGDSFSNKVIGTYKDTYNIIIDITKLKNNLQTEGHNINKIYKHILRLQPYIKELIERYYEILYPY